MIITFLGHSLIPSPNNLREKIKGTFLAYVKHNYGGAYKCLEYAKRIKKTIINLATNN